jgi:ATP synthase protein I
MWRSALRFSAVGIEMGVAVAVGYGAGFWLDKTFGTRPTFTVVMILFGVAAAFKAIISAARRAMKEEARKGEGDGS